MSLCMSIMLDLKNNFVDNEAQSGSMDNGDPNTTNLYIGNINPKVFILINKRYI